MTHPIKINENTIRVLNKVKEKYGLKNKSEAANLILKQYEEGLFKLKL